MVSKSYPNILDMNREDGIISRQPFISDLDLDTRCDSDFVGSASSAASERKIIVANFLPLNYKKDEATGQWSYANDDDALLMQLKDGFSDQTEVFYVGSLKVQIDPNEQEQVAEKLFREHRCIPTFLPDELQLEFYHGFCKQQLWPLCHYMLPECLDKHELFDRALFHAYLRANKIFADKVMEAINSDDDYVWVHDYHLMLVPTFLRKKLHQVKLGFFLHSPFPSSEIYRTLPVRVEILKSLLNADLIGFQTFDYARHFLSCCSRLLGLYYESKRGHIGIDYFGRVVCIKILPVGVHVGRLESVLKLLDTVSKIKEIKQIYEGKMMVLGVDDMNIFKGISLKLLGLELLLERNPMCRGKVVLIQIVNPARSIGKDVKDAINEAVFVAERINNKYGSAYYKPVVLINYPIPFYEKIAFYAASEYCIVNAVRDGMNLTPYEFVVCRQGNEEMDELRCADDEKSLYTSTLIVSEFVGCSPSLSGAFKVNPWSVEDIASALYFAIELTESEKQLRHEKHYSYISSHDVAYWSRSFALDLERVCRDHHNRRYWAIGFGLNFRVIALSPGFRKLSLENLISSYKNTTRRAIFLDYDGTLVSQSSINKPPTPKLLSALNNLCNDPKNIVFIVSGRGRTSLSDWFASCDKIGIAAEQGYFVRWNAAAEWETSSSSRGHGWKKIAEPVMEVYTETTDGSFIERKESALVWHYQDTHYDFGYCQAKELLDHLERVLSNEPVVVKHGHHIVEVKPQEISKGIVVDKLIDTLIKRGGVPDFFMCVGDDRSNEDMFESINSMTCSRLAFPTTPEVFACTVGQKPSKAKYYVDDSDEVIRLLKSVAAISSRGEVPNHEVVTFKDLLNDA